MNTFNIVLKNDIKQIVNEDKFLSQIKYERHLLKAFKNHFTIKFNYLHKYNLYFYFYSKDYIVFYNKEEAVVFKLKYKIIPKTANVDGMYLAEVIDKIEIE